MNKFFKLSFLTSLLVLISIVFLNMLDSKVTVSSFGAIGDDQKEDTDAIQKAIDFQSDHGGGVVILSKGVYLIDSVKSLILKDNITLKFKKGAILQAIPNKADNYEVVRIKDVKNVTLTGDVNIKGDRLNHIGKTGEWGFGISITGSENIKVENAEISNCWGDGIYIGSTEIKGYSNQINISDVTLINNRRQGISIISAKNLEISNANILNTNGTAPESGIDLEPNFSTEYLENIKITNLKTENNSGYGLQIYLKNLRGSINPVSIEIVTSNNLPDGFYVGEYEGIEGKILIEDFFTHILE
ncbi:right-handed parallel beta-helix repeat-containing protein [Planococcus soli]|uniref:right-handed parallel beta-helix repeat-containing protein n=1 Tax=Planococcus soli TaxID=2666072 RepID=UPI00163D7ACD|nr:right-handed parallel beta-helix repeat-containing protein [Planococcus soli]